MFDLSNSIDGNGLFRLQYNLKKVKSSAKEWSTNKGNSTKQVHAVKAELKSSIATLERDSSSVSLQITSMEKRENVKWLIKQEEADLKQRSKVNWLRLRDSKYYYKNQFCGVTLSQLLYKIL